MKCFIPSHILKLLLTVLVSISCCGSLTLAETDSSSVDGLNELKVKVETWKLSNGIKVVFYRRHTAPVFAGQVWVRVGGVDEQVGLTGIAHFLEHMAFKGSEVIGTKDYSKEKGLLARLEEIVTTADDQTAALHGLEASSILKELSLLLEDNELGRIYTKAGASGLNAMTSKDYTSYVVKLPSSAFELWCWMESDRLLNPVFRQFYKEREVVQEERRHGYEDDPGGKLYEGLLQKAFTSHPYRFPTIGYSQDLKKLTATQMRKFYDEHYVPHNMTLSLVGDIPIEDAKELTEKYFSRIKKGQIDEIKEGILPETPQTESRSVVLNLDAQPQLIIAYHKPTAPDLADAHFSVLHSLLSEGRSSLLNKILVEEERLALGVDTGEAPGERYDNLFYVEVTAVPGIAAEVIVDRVQQILDTFITNPPNTKLIEEAKKRSRIAILKLLSSDEGLASILGKTQSLYGDWKEIFRFYSTMEKTTASDLAELSRKYLQPSNRTVAEIKSTKESAK
jgi:predicted Zn-dependent peptidase